MKRDALGDRMKRYENATRDFLMPRSYTIMRIDGKAFHTFTKGLEKPLDKRIEDGMIGAMAALFEKIQGVKYAYTQSDEISLIITDFDTFETQPWFGGNVQKMTSVSASIAANGFNKSWLYDAFIKGSMNMLNYDKIPWAEFDSRVFQLPNKNEVINYLIWRQQDAIRNSISSSAQALFSPNKLHGMNQIQMKEMLKSEGVIWDELPIAQQRGIGFYKWIDDIGEGMVRHVSQPDFSIPIFSENREYLEKLIPDYI